MFSFGRKFVSALMIVLMLNAFSWSVGSAALTDWVQSQQDSGAIMKSAVDTAGEHEGLEFDTHCNAGCHAAAHLQGTVVVSFVFLLDSATSFVPVPSNIAEEESVTSLYRPPRPAVLAGLQ
jgi:hypothetical protein